MKLTKSSQLYSDAGYSSELEKFKRLYKDRTSKPQHTRTQTHISTLSQPQTHRSIGSLHSTQNRFLIHREFKQNKNLNSIDQFDGISNPQLKQQVKDFLSSQPNRWQEQANSRKTLPPIVQVQASTEGRDYNTNDDMQMPQVDFIKNDGFRQQVQPQQCDDLWEEIRTGGQIRGRAYHSAIVYRDQLYVYGGRDNTKGAYGELYVLEKCDQSYRWQQLQIDGDGPNYLSGHCAVVIGECMYVYGGRLSAICNSNRLYCLNLDSLSWECIVISGQVGVDGHRGVNMEGQMVVSFGYVSSPNPGATNILQIFDGREWRIWPQNGNGMQPGGRCYHSAMVLRDDMWIYGGRNEEEILKDLWKWNMNEGWREVKGSNKGPGMRYGHVSFYDDDKENLFIFGGTQGLLGEKNDLWRFSPQYENWECIEKGVQAKSLVQIDSIVMKRKPSLRKGFNRQSEFDDEESIRPSEKSFMKFDIRKTHMLEHHVPSSHDFKPPATNLQKEREQQLAAYRKQELLSNFEITQEESKRLLLQTPISAQIYQSILDTDKKEAQQGYQQKYNQILQAATRIMKVKIQRPLPRDNPTISPFLNGWILFGGDRHKVTFNDLWFLQSKSLNKYQQQS